jgi:Fic family protein
MRTTGTEVLVSTPVEPYRAFLPRTLPPDPPLQLGFEHQALIERAHLALGRLDGLSTLMPNASLLLYAYVRKEAVLSSQIEGTQSSLADLLLYESDQAPGVPVEDVREVSDYVAALEHGLERMHGGFPLSLRLLREVHGILLRSGRGSEKLPGEFRRSQVWIGGSRPGNARFVPPPAEAVTECMGALETFLHDDPEKTPALIKAGLAHVQFEAIHPFLDGNGRLGRLLITMILCAEGVLAQPILYASLYFKVQRLEYYERLQRVRTHGDWEGWLRFFLEGLATSADDAVSTARRCLALFESDRQKLSALGRAAASGLRVHECLQRKPIARIGDLARQLGLTYPTVASALARMQRLGIVDELTGFARNRVFTYAPYIELLNEGTEPLQ